ncbi:disease resistance protein RGH3 [Striga asiatica]|uniref:Disease resistance protein RGH3 n=1 Tax=Striga asiatica TaxID=4170 RepID=A0A5A7R5F5_STRAF|nr:disease resistance protein RGH3 [Striga asiatica]
MHLVVLGDDPEVKQGKPSSDVFIAAAKRFEGGPVDPQKILVFEDTPSGVLVAKNAGMSVAMVGDPRLDNSYHQTADKIFKPKTIMIEPNLVNCSVNKLSLDIRLNRENHIRATDVRGQAPDDLYRANTVLPYHQAFMNKRYRVLVYRGSMAAYGALMSLTTTIHQIQNHPHPPISLHKIKIEPLIEKVDFLQDFLENYTIDDDADDLEGRMVDVANKAEDIIESHIAYHIWDEYEDPLYQYMQKMMEEPEEAEESQIAHHIEEEVRGEANKDDKDSCLYGELQKVIHDLDSITKDVAAAIEGKARKKIAPKDDATKYDVMNMANKPYSGGSNDVMNDVMSKLTDRQSSRWIIAIAGMGGIGKTTLAQNIYECRVIVEHFDIRGWSTISQEFNSKRILLEVLDCLKNKGSEESEYEELGQKLYQSLFGRRYLIVMDDIWGTDAWEEVKRFFPISNDNEGSRVLITTRSSEVALELDGQDYFQMPFLKVDESWNLLRRCVFGEQGCPPPELEEIGKNIATNCRGLPLSIVVIGGLLAKSEKTWENWQRVLENVSSIVNLENDECCLRILKLSYNQLPVHLKPCFLYMGMYPEDHKIEVSILMDLWVNEGFVEPVAGESLETIAEVVYLNDLVLRNLVVVHELDGRWGCSIHDLLRDLCIKEAEKYKFFRTTQNYPDHDQSWCAQRRISTQQVESEKKYTRSLVKVFASPLPEAVQSASRARTLISDFDQTVPSFVPFRLLRVLHGYIKGGELFHMVNLRLLSFKLTTRQELEFPPEFYLLWNLRTLRIYHVYRRGGYAAVLDIWRMPQLKHVMIYGRFQLTEPKEVENGCWMVLENLETLTRVLNFKCNEEMVERIPNIKNLGIQYDELLSGADYDLDNLCRLHKLVSLDFNIYSRKSEVMMRITFPVTLRWLTLHGTRLGWEEMGPKVGSLPHLEALTLNPDAFVGPEWKTAEGEFQSLRYLLINRCSDLEKWRVEATDFPCLERLKIAYLDKLDEFPLGIGNINTLREIEVVDCSDFAVLSAKKILEEQLECLGEVDLQITVVLLENQLPNLTSGQNFTIKQTRFYYVGKPRSTGVQA